MKQFKTESKRMLDMMINSVYTHKEIFLREIISNASDATDKFYYQALSEGETGLDRNDLSIRISVDKSSRTLTVSDNGIGMTKDELENNLGIIANSGSLKFKNENESDDVDIIGQFGVGFYSAFMVADEITVTTKAYSSDEAYEWYSKGVSGYRVTEAQKDSRGTEIKMHIKENSEDENYDEFLEEYRIRQLVKKYSDYIRYPIKMMTTKSKLKEGTGTEEIPAEYEEYKEDDTLNSMVPLWKKSKSETTDEECESFYKEKFFDWNSPARIIRLSTEGTATFEALLFIPQKPQMDFYTKDYETGLQLYASGVMIMEKCADLLPDCFSFVRGVVDSQDLSLNISREMLQHDRQLKIIAGRIEKKIASELKIMLQSEREKYDEFFEGFGLQLKYGMYEGYGKNKDMLKDLVMFYSSSEKKLSTLAEYVSRMPEEQEFIYYGCGETHERVLQLPQADMVMDKGYEILCFADNIDEFAIKMLAEYEGKKFRNVSSDEIDLQSDEEKAETEKLAEGSADLLKLMKEHLGDKVKDVVVSSRLKRHPVCLSTDGEISTEMEKVINAMPSGEKIKAERVLEINPHHSIFETLKSLADNSEKLGLYTDVLYGEALLIEGIALENPVEFAENVSRIMTDR